MQKRFEYRFEWDPDKARGNVIKHNVSFERAATVFHDPLSLSLFDIDHSESEDRWITLGLDHFGILLVICHTFSTKGVVTCQIRIFSARKATHKETERYRRHSK